MTRLTRAALWRLLCDAGAWVWRVLCAALAGIAIGYALMAIGEVFHACGVTP